MVTAAVVVTVVVGSGVVTAAVGLPEDMVVGLAVGMVAGLAAAASVAVGLGVASGVVRLAVSAEPRSVAGFAELDLTASAAEASASLAFAATGAFPSRQV